MTRSPVLTAVAKRLSRTTSTKPVTDADQAEDLKTTTSMSPIYAGHPPVKNIDVRSFVRSKILPGSDQAYQNQYSRSDPSAPPTSASSSSLSLASFFTARSSASSSGSSSASSSYWSLVERPSTPKPAANTNKKKKKSVSFAPYSVIVSERRERTPPTPQKVAARALERCLLPAEPIQLTVSLLLKIHRFVKYAGYKVEHLDTQPESTSTSESESNTEITSHPALLFAVEYKSGKIGLVQCGPAIPGNPGTVQDAFLLHTKVEMGKMLVDRDDWRYIEYRFKYKREAIMRFEWVDALRQKVEADNRRPLGSRIADAEAAQRERYARRFVGRAEKVVEVTKRAVGAWVRSLNPFARRRRYD
ncbi:hypothetical protein BJX64DRAFT_284068 [Aspergillus heterothallicus]